MTFWIGWLAPALMVVATVIGSGNGRSRPALLMWTLALLCLVVVSAWPVNVALCGVIVGARAAAVARAEL